MSIEKLKRILMQENVVESINNNLNKLIEIIPEIKDMIGFEHNHPHHHLDVWNHTLLALSRAPFDFEIRLILLLHDIGKPHSYQDDEIRHFKNHASVSSEMAKGIFKRLGFDNEQIEEMVYLIKEHDSLLRDEDIKNNRALAFKRFQIQFCDGLAHHPDKLEKRIKYLLEINEKLNLDKLNIEYAAQLNKILLRK